ncbi:MAG: hypothetical protein ACLQFW_02705 [Xanthobacteraceae bacterium]
MLPSDQHLVQLGAVHRNGQVGVFLALAGVARVLAVFQRTTAPPNTDGNKMLTALILICSLTSVSDVAACTEDNALQVLRSPETFASPVTCLMHGQAYVANSAIGRDLNAGETVKVICKRNRIVAAPPAETGGINTAQEAFTRQ